MIRDNTQQSDKKIIKGRTILVTGGAGFIGSHLVDKLIKKGNKVVVIDNLSTGRKENLNSKAKFYKIDIQNQKISQIFKKEKPEIVFHYAAQIDVRKSVENPVSDAKINILGAINLLENCKKFRVKKFIFASSVGVYGEPKILPVKESHFVNPISPYSVTKLVTEKYLNYYQNQGLDFVALRYSNIYGPRQLGSGEGGVVAIFIDKILKEKKPTIFGDGNQTRDFLYVDDAVNAAILAVKATPGSIYNAGMSREINIKNLLKLICRLEGKSAKPVFLPFRLGEIIRSRVDYSRIKKELNWQPKYLLEEGLKGTLKWFKKKYETSSNNSSL